MSDEHVCPAIMSKALASVNSIEPGKMFHPIADESCVAGTVTATHLSLVPWVTVKVVEVAHVVTCDEGM